MSELKNTVIRHKKEASNEAKGQNNPTKLREAKIAKWYHSKKKKVSFEE